MGYNFDDLFTMEMANNHQGSVEHGKRIIAEIGKVVKDTGVKAAMKLQFRDLDTFIHPDHINDEGNRHVKRFKSTRLSKDEFAQLFKASREAGMITMCTPFDERSVDLIEEMDVEIVKIGSCSAMDWPLLERVARTGKPAVLSTGGLKSDEIDRVVSFFKCAAPHCLHLDSGGVLM